MNDHTPPDIREAFIPSTSVFRKRDYRTREAALRSRPVRLELTPLQRRLRSLRRRLRGRIPALVVAATAGAALATALMTLRGWRP